MNSFVTTENEVLKKFNELNEPDFVNVIDVTPKSLLLTRSQTEKWEFKQDGGQVYFKVFNSDLSEPISHVTVVALINTTLSPSDIEFLRIRPDNDFPKNYTRVIEVRHRYIRMETTSGWTAGFERDLYFIFDQKVDRCESLEVRLNTWSGGLTHQIGSLVISRKIDFDVLFENCRFGAKDISTKVRSEGGQISATLKPVLQTASITTIVDRKAAWGDGISGPVLGFSDNWRDIGTANPLCFVYESLHSGQNISIYATMDKLNELIPVRAKNSDDTDVQTGASSIYWKTTLNITEEL